MERRSRGRLLFLPFVSIATFALSFLIRLMENNVKLYATSTACQLGEKIASCLNQPLMKIHTERFSDGELFVRFNESVRGKLFFCLHG